MHAQKTNAQKESCVCALWLVRPNPHTCIAPGKHPWWAAGKAGLRGRSCKKGKKTTPCIMSKETRDVPIKNKKIISRRLPYG